MIPLTLDQIAEVVGGEVHGDDGDVVVTAPASVDSRAVEPGGLFVAIAGEHVDGHDFVADAVGDGAVAVLAAARVDAPCVVVADVAAALGRLARARRSTSSRPSRSSAITGPGQDQREGPRRADPRAQRTDRRSGRRRSTTSSASRSPCSGRTSRPAILVVEMGARGIGHIAELCAIVRPDIGVVLNVGNAHIGEFGIAEVIAPPRAKWSRRSRPKVSPSSTPTTPGRTRWRRGPRPRSSPSGTPATSRSGPVELDASGEPPFTLTYAGGTTRRMCRSSGEHHAIECRGGRGRCHRCRSRSGDGRASDWPTAGTASPMRMARTQRADGVLIINDAYNANPGIGGGRAAARSPPWLEDAAVAVLGEMLELGADSHEAHSRGRPAGRRAGLRLSSWPWAKAAWPIAEGAGSDRRRSRSTTPMWPFGHCPRAWRVDDVVLVKASRGGRLERVAEALLQG